MRCSSVSHGWTLLAYSSASLRQAQSKAGSVSMGVDEAVMARSLSMSRGAVPSPWCGYKAAETSGTASKGPARASCMMLAVCV